MGEPSPVGPDIMAIVGGDVAGQVAVGTDIRQVHIGSVHGAVLTLPPEGFRLTLRPKPLPVLLLPRRFPGLLGREQALAEVAAALAGGEPVQVHGGPEVGKSVLLRHLAHLPPPESLVDGVVHVSASGGPVADVLQDLFDAFHEPSAPFKPTPVRLREGLQHRRALLVLDDAAFDRRQLAELLDATRSCGVVLASPQRELWGEGVALALAGLAEQPAIALAERELGRTLTGAERPGFRLLWERVGGNPGRLLRAAAAVRQGGGGFADLAAAAAGADPAAAMVGELDEGQRRVLEPLAAMPGVAMAAEHLAALSGIETAPELLEGLRELRVVATSSPAYRLEAGLAGGLASDGDAWRERALDYGIGLAEAQRLHPQRLGEELPWLLWLLRWATGSGRNRAAVRLGRALDPALALGRRWGAWELALEAVRSSAAATGDQAGRAWALHQLGTRALCLEQDASARDLLRQALAVRERLGDRTGAAVTRHNLGFLAAAAPHWREQRVARPPRAPRWLWPALLVVALAGVLVAGVVEAITDPGPTSTTSGPTTQSTGPDPTGTTGDPTTRGQPGIALPSLLRFGTVATGTTATRTVTVDSTGTAPVRVTSVAVGGAAAAQYRAQAAGDCAAVAPGRSCTITVAYQPTAAGTHPATLLVGHDAPGGTGTVPLVGASFVPATLVLDLSPAGVGEVTGPGIRCQGQCAPQKVEPGTVTLSATASDPDYYFRAWVGACGNAPTKQTCTLQLAPGATATVTADFEQNVP